MGRKKVNYSTDELRTLFKYICIKGNTMYATKGEMPFKDDDEIYVFDDLQEKYTNKKDVWFEAKELEMVGEQICLFSL